MMVILGDWKQLLQVGDQIRAAKYKGQRWHTFVQQLKSAPTTVCTEARAVLGGTESPVEVYVCLD